MDVDRNDGLLQTCLDDHYGEILNFMYLRVGNRIEAEDLTQDTFLAAVKGISAYRQEASLRTWIFSIARRTLANAYENQSKGRRLIQRMKKQLVLRRNHTDHGNNTELFSLLDTLQEYERELVILKHYLGFTYEEIAEMTGLTSSNVGVKLSRTMQRLKSLGEGGEWL